MGEIEKNDGEQLQNLSEEQILGGEGEDLKMEDS